MSALTPIEEREMEKKEKIPNNDVRK